jgi:flagellar basal body-associated protein FliL
MDIHIYAIAKIILVHIMTTAVVLVVVVAEASALMTRSDMCTTASNKNSYSTSKEVSPTFLN